MRERQKAQAFKILQVLPADGWRAVHASGEDGTPFASTLVCWALVTSPEDRDGQEIGEVFAWGEQMLVGLSALHDGSVSAPILDDNFLGYAEAGESLDGFNDEAREHFEKRQAKP
jgi:hypothetical protein